MANNLKTTEQKLSIEYWPTTPIIVNGIVAHKFYNSNLTNSYQR